MTGSGVQSGLDNGLAQPDDAGQSYKEEIQGPIIEYCHASAVFRNRPAQAKALIKPRTSWGGRDLGTQDNEGNEEFSVERAVLGDSARGRRYLTSFCVSPSSVENHRDRIVTMSLDHLSSGSHTSLPS